jgi:hypothetical protein
MFCLLGMLFGKTLHLGAAFAATSLAALMSCALAVDTDGDGIEDDVETNVTFTDPTLPSFGTAIVPPPVYTNPLVNGTYTGLVFDAAGTPLGNATVRLSNRGALSGNFVGFGTRGTLRGSFDSVGAYHGASRIPGITGETMVIYQDAISNMYRIQGQFNSPSGTQYFELRRALYSRVNVTTWTGDYTFKASHDGTATTATGDLVGTMKVSSDGRVRATSYSPDNQTGTWSGTINEGDIIPFFAGTGGTRVVAAGMLAFRDIPLLTDIDGQIRLYRAPGFGNDVYVVGYDQTRALEGSRFNKNLLLAIPSLPNTAYNVIGQFTDGKVTGDSVVASWTTNGQITAPRNNIFGFSGRYTRNTGVITATYSINDPSRQLSNARATVRAVPIQKQDIIAGQYYLKNGGGHFTFTENIGGLPPALTLISPRVANVTGDGAVYDVTVTSNTGPWDAEVISNSNWVTVGPGGINDGIVTIDVDRNETGLRREAYVRIAGQIHVIKQDHRLTPTP